MAHATPAPTSSADADRGADAGEARQGTDPKWWTLAAVCLGVFMLLLDITIVNVALHDIQTDLHATLPDAQWVLDAYALSLAALLLTAGSLADLYGRKRLFIIGLILFTAGSALCGAAPNVTFLSIARAGQGIGGAAMFATALALLATAFTGKDRGTAFAAFGATTGVSVAVGPVLGGVLTSGLSWRWIFFVNIPLCAIALFITIRKVKESHNPRAGRPDWFGFVSFSAALALLVYGLIEAGENSWGDTKVVVCLIAAAVLFAIFLVSQNVQKQPMFDLSLLRKPTFTGGLIAAFAISGGIFSLLTYLVLYLQGVLGFSAVQAGLVFLCLSATSFVAAILAGRLTQKVPIKFLIAPGFVLVGVGLLLMRGISYSQSQHSWTHLALGLAIAGFGVGMVNPPLASTAVGVVAPAQSGMASGVNSTFRQVGIATGIAALGSILAHQVTSSAGSALSGTVPKSALGGVLEGLDSGQVQAVAAQSAQATAAAAPSGSGQQAGAAAAKAINLAGTHAYVDALNHILLIGMVGSFAAAVFALLLIRQKDFVVQGGPPPAATSDPSATDGALESGQPTSEHADHEEHRHLDPQAHELPVHGGAHAAGVHAAPVPDDEKAPEPS